MSSGNPNLSSTPLRYGNPNGRPPEEDIRIVTTPALERPASSTPLEGQSLVKKGRNDSVIGELDASNGIDVL
ncbi:hypothetical protein V6N13_044006 [Hibiscus sabdariffa]